MAKHIVATVDEIPPGERKIVEVAGRTIGVFNVNGEFYALRNSCPHQGGPLCMGRLTGFLTARVPGEYHYARRGEILRCPWHGWEFDVLTGQSWFDPARTRVRTYPVTVEKAQENAAASKSDPDEGMAQESAPEPTPDVSEGSETAREGLQKGPYVAETYPVSVERQLVLVEVP